MVTKKATIKNGYGIHCRPSTVIAKEAMEYKGIIEVKLNHRKAKLGSILELLALGIRCGNLVEISVTGPDEEATANQFVELFERDFDFKR